MDQGSASEPTEGTRLPSPYTGPGSENVPKKHASSTPATGRRQEVIIVFDTDSGSTEEARLCLFPGGRIVASTSRFPKLCSLVPCVSQLPSFCGTKNGQNPGRPDHDRRVTHSEGGPSAFVDPTTLTSSPPSAGIVFPTHSMEISSDRSIVDPSTSQESISSLDFTFTSAPFQRGMDTARGQDWFGQTVSPHETVRPDPVSGLLHCKKNCTSSPSSTGVSVINS